MQDERFQVLEDNFQPKVYMTLKSLDKPNTTINVSAATGPYLNLVDNTTAPSSIDGWTVAKGGEITPGMKLKVVGRDCDVELQKIYAQQLQ